MSSHCLFWRVASKTSDRFASHFVLMNRKHFYIACPIFLYLGMRIEKIRPRDSTPSQCWTQGHSSSSTEPGLVLCLHLLWCWLDTCVVFFFYQREIWEHSDITPSLSSRGTDGAVGTNPNHLERFSVVCPAILSPLFTFRKSVCLYTKHSLAPFSLYQMWVLTLSSTFFCF